MDILYRHALDIAGLMLLEYIKRFLINSKEESAMLLVPTYYFLNDFHNYYFLFLKIFNSFYFVIFLMLIFILKSKESTAKNEY